MSRTSSNGIKLRYRQTELDCTKFFLTNDVVRERNKLPPSVVQCRGASRVQKHSGLREKHQRLKFTVSEKKKKMWGGGPVCVHHHAPKINTYSYAPRLHSKLQTAQTTGMWLQNVIFSMKYINNISSVQTADVQYNLWKKKKDI